MEAVETVNLLLDEGLGGRRRAHRRCCDVALQQIVNHGGEAAFLHLLIEVAEIFAVAAEGVGAVEHEPAPGLQAGGNDPVGVAGQDHVQHVFGRDDILIFPFDRDVFFSDQPLEAAFMLFVAGIKGFVGE